MSVLPLERVFASDARYVVQLATLCLDDSCDARIRQRRMIGLLVYVGLCHRQVPFLGHHNPQTSCRRILTTNPVVNLG